MEYSSSFFPAQNKRYITGVSRESAPLEFEVEIIGEEGYCSVHERAIKNWLFNSPTFKKLYIDPEDDMEAEYVGGEIKRQYLECIFANPQKIEYSEGTVGWRCTCICSSTMAIQEDIEHIISDTNQIPVSTDKNGDVYNGCGYKENVYLDGEASEIIRSGSGATGLIPLPHGTMPNNGQIVLFISNAELTMTDNTRVLYYDQTRTYKGSSKGSIIELEDSTSGSTVPYATVDSNNYIVRLDISKVVYYLRRDSYDVSYIRLTGDGIDGDTIITVNNWLADTIVNVDTDINDYVYPYLVITCTNASSETTVTITNKTDNNRAMQIKDATAGVVIYADCAMGTIINNAETEYYNKLVNQHFLRLLPGVNTISVTGNVESIKFTWKNARWMT